VTDGGCVHVERGARPTFSQIIPTIDSLPASGLTPRLYYWSISSEHLVFYV